MEFRGNVFSVAFNGQKLFEVEDSTFPQAGKIGLWTKADSVTYFDEVGIRFTQVGPTGCGSAVVFLEVGWTI